MSRDGAKVRLGYGPAWNRARKEYRRSKVTRRFGPAREGYSTTEATRIAEAKARRASGQAA